jgi:hypothetical protein
MKKFVIVFFVIFIFVSLPVHAGVITGNGLIEWMREHEKPSSDPSRNWTGEGMFMGYAVAVADASQRNKLVCLPTGLTTIGQISAVAAKFLNDNLERWSEPAYVLVVDALKTAFPCKK